MDIKAIFGRNLQAARKAARLSQEALAAKIETSQTHLSQIETGRAFVSSALLEKISAALRVSPSTLFYSARESLCDESEFGKIDGILDDAMACAKQKIRSLARV